MDAIFDRVRPKADFETSPSGNLPDWRSIISSEPNSQSRMVTKLAFSQFLLDHRGHACWHPVHSASGFDVGPQLALTKSTEISTAGVVPLFSSQCVVFLSSGQPTPGPYSLAAPSRWSVIVPCST